MRVEVKRKNIHQIEQTKNRSKLTKTFAVARGTAKTNLRVVTLKKVEFLKKDEQS
jgi:hypothetical protein